MMIFYCEQSNLFGAMANNIVKPSPTRPPKSFPIFTANHMLLNHSTDAAFVPVQPKGHTLSPLEVFISTVQNAQSLNWSEVRIRDAIRCLYIQSKVEPSDWALSVLTLICYKNNPDKVADAVRVVLQDISNDTACPIYTFLRSLLQPQQQPIAAIVLL
jgi:hypothetical protein